MRSPRVAALAAFLAAAFGAADVSGGAPDTEHSDDAASPAGLSTAPEEASPNAFASPVASAFGEIPVRGESGGGQLLGEATAQTTELVIELALERMPSDRPWALDVTYPAHLLGRARALPPGQTASVVEPPEPGHLAVRSTTVSLAPDDTRAVVSRSDVSGEALLCAPEASRLPVGRFAIPLAQRGALEGQDLPLELALRLSADEQPGPRPCVVSAWFHADVDRAAGTHPPRRRTAR